MQSTGYAASFVQEVRRITIIEFEPEAVQDSMGFEPNAGRRFLVSFAIWTLAKLIGFEPGNGLVLLGAR